MAYFDSALRHYGNACSESGPRDSTVRIANVLRASVNASIARIWSSNRLSNAPRFGITASIRKSASPEDDGRRRLPGDGHGAARWRT